MTSDGVAAFLLVMKPEWTEIVTSIMFILCFLVMSNSVKFGFDKHQNWGFYITKAIGVNRG